MSRVKHSLLGVQSWNNRMLSVLQYVFLSDIVKAISDILRISFISKGKTNISCNDNECFITTGGMNLASSSQVMCAFSVTDSLALLFRPEQSAVQEEMLPAWTHRRLSSCSQSIFPNGRWRHMQIRNRWISEQHFCQCSRVSLLVTPNLP